MTDEHKHKHDEPVTASEPAVEVVERESLMDKISEKLHHGGDSSSDDDDKNMSSDSSSSMKSKVYRLFGREKPVHKVLGGGKRTVFAPIWFCFRVIWYLNWCDLDLGLVKGVVLCIKFHAF